MKKHQYLPPSILMIQLSAVLAADDFNIAVSGQTTPEESDGKESSFDVDDYDNPWDAD